MKTIQSNLASAVAAIAIMVAGTCVHAGGFQQGIAADQGGKPIVIGIWYPSQTVAQPVSTGPTTMTVAINAPVIGGVPDLTKIGPMCRQYPGDFACQLLARGASPVVAPATSAVADARIKAAVVAAPALGFTFSPDGLKNVKVPVQLWRAENDALVPHPRYAETVRLALAEAPDYRVVSNAGHYDFLAPCSAALASIAPAIRSSAAGFDRAAFHVGFDSDIVKFFERTLDVR